ncbi:GTP 3',8-cyclase [Actinomycetes bacterium]|nr:GTP 3',8-cyclase [Actinomycetes bacterium]
MPHDFAAWLPSEHQLTTDELVRVIEIAVREGINEVRLTGGEPLLRPDIVEIVSRINAITNAPTLTMTTNALTLEKVAKPLVDAGLTRINISLDTLDKDRFKLMTHRDRIDDVFAGIKAAQDAGINPIKINAVLLKGVNADEAPALLEWALTNNLALRFIEQMPLDAGGIWERSALVTADDIYADLSTRYELTPCDGRGSSPAEEFFVNGGPATVGIIGSVTRPFCGACDRLRLTSDGQLRSCLFSLEEMDLRTAMRNGASDEDIAARFRKTVAGKLPGHGINDPKFIQPQRPMSAIGG